MVVETILNNLEELPLSGNLEELPLSGNLEELPLSVDQSALTQEFVLLMKIKLNFLIIGIHHSFRINNPAETVKMIQAKLNEVNRLKREVKDPLSSVIVEAEFTFSQSYINYKYHDQTQSMPSQDTKHPDIEILEQIQKSINQKEELSILEARITLLICRLWFAFTKKDNIEKLKLEKQLSTAIVIFEQEILESKPNWKWLELKAWRLTARFYET